MEPVLPKKHLPEFFNDIPSTVCDILCILVFSIPYMLSGQCFFFHFFSNSVFYSDSVINLYNGHAFHTFWLIVHLHLSYIYISSLALKALSSILHPVAWHSQDHGAKISAAAWAFPLHGAKYHPWVRSGARSNLRFGKRCWMTSPCPGVEPCWPGVGFTTSWMPKRCSFSKQSGNILKQLHPVLINK